MNILLSNDDGYFSEGLSCLQQALSEEHQVTVVAPDRNCSGASSSLTLERPIRCKETIQGYFSVNGTPTDCVHLGIYQLMQTAPDIVVSGINQGANLGDDVWYSGTVAAAAEGRSLGFPAIAVSLEMDPTSSSPHYLSAAKAVVHIVKQLNTSGIAKGTILNVNVPDRPYEEIKGYQLTRLGQRYRSDTIIAETDPKGKPIYWLGPMPSPEDRIQGTDFHAIEEGYISITPMTIDLTAYDSFNEVAGWVSKL